VSQPQKMGNRFNHVTLDASTVC